MTPGRVRLNGGPRSGQLVYVRNIFEPLRVAVEPPPPWVHGPIDQQPPRTGYYRMEPALHERWTHIGSFRPPKIIPFVWEGWT